MKTLKKSLILSGIICITGIVLTFLAASLAYSRQSVDNPFLTAAMTALSGAYFDSPAITGSLSSVVLFGASMYAIGGLILLLSAVGILLNIICRYVLIPIFGRYDNSKFA